ncbi:MAG: hypothetical protein RIM23_09975 [Coleofasciculus sp. G3-WIS-01]|uniref:hypothetical protein n=1 Tax=Coleofasciculus sp. G3-WIS-01 TaxID=3069528 RepID=UPI00330223B9
MNKDEFKIAVIASTLGSARIARILNTYGIANRIRLAVEMTDRAWNFIDNDSSFLLLTYASLLGSKGHEVGVTTDQYEPLWEEAKELVAKSLDLRDEWE